MSISRRQRRKSCSPNSLRRQRRFADGELLIGLVFDEVDAAVEAAVAGDDVSDEVPFVVDVALGWHGTAGVSIVPVDPIILLRWGRHDARLPERGFPLVMFRPRMFVGEVCVHLRPHVVCLL
jgi:hypothetical protein